MPAKPVSDSCSLLLVDPAPVVRVGLESMLAGTRFVISESAHHVDSARRALTSQEFDLVLSEFMFEDGTAEDLWRSCRRERVPLALFSSRFNPVFVSRLARAGVCGLIGRTLDTASLCEQLEQAVAGERLWTRNQLRKANAALVAGPLQNRFLFPLTERELQVLRLLASGNSNRKIAKRLDIGFETVKEHVQHLLAKLEVADRTQAAVLAQRHGLLPVRGGV